uniref:Transmembrane protein n=1 Tax=Pyrodinium bahamense TaxID=73915 RepID=A0A7S0FY13_9DINO
MFLLMLCRIPSFTAGLGSSVQSFFHCCPIRIVAYGPGTRATQRPRGEPHASRQVVALQVGYGYADCLILTLTSQFDANNVLLRMAIWAETGAAWGLFAPLIAVAACLVLLLEEWAFRVACHRYAVASDPGEIQVFRCSMVTGLAASCLLGACHLVSAVDDGDRLYVLVASVAGLSCSGLATRFCVRCGQPRLLRRSLALDGRDLPQVPASEEAQNPPQVPVSAPGATAEGAFIQLPLR